MVVAKILQGAAAVLEFYAIESPLAQPRSAVLGQLVAAITGVSVAKLFLLSEQFVDIQWIAGALACAAATALMALTKTVHPPAGATALLAVVDNQLLGMGWLFIPLVLLSCALMLGVALIVNNIERQFPIYWWTPQHREEGDPVLVRVRSGQGAGFKEADVERALPGILQTAPNPNGEIEPVSGETTDVEPSTPPNTAVEYAQVDELIIRHGQVTVPENMFLTQEEEMLLETMCYRI